MASSKTLDELSPSFKAQLDARGYVILPSIISPGLLKPLTEACHRTIEKTRNGSWPYRRMVGKQFPPFTGDNTDSWGVQHLMNPKLNEPVFAEWYGSKEVIEMACQLMDCQPQDLQLELFNLLINPECTPYGLRWHRDDIPVDVDPIEERERLNLSSYGIQWNTALLTDPSLYIVPGTHKALLTPEQKRLCTPLTPERPLDMPGSIKLELQPGQTVVYDNNMLHCAVYNPKSPRITLHACTGDARGGKQRARNILQHEVDWLQGDEMMTILKVLDEQDGGIRVNMLHNLLTMAKGVDRTSLGYSLKD